MQLKNIVLYILTTPILILTAQSPAQERPLPPTRITLPSDSVVVKTPQKLEADSSKIELPDVVVLGRDRSLRMVENKKGSSREQPRLLAPAYAPVSIWARRDQNRNLAGDAPAAQDLRIWAGAKGGSYASLQADAGFRGKFNWGTTRLAAWMDRSNGAFNNSQHSQGGFEAVVQTSLRPDLDGSVEVAYTKSLIGGHGAVLSDLKRASHISAFALNADYKIDPKSQASARLHWGGTGLESDTSAIQWRQNNSFTLGLTTRYQRQWEKWTLIGAAAYDRESLTSDRDSVDIMAGRTEIRMEAETKLTETLRTTAGIGWQSCSADSGDVSRMTFLGRVAFLPNPVWGLTLSVTSGLNYQTVANRMNENPYLNHVIPLTADDRPLAIQLRADTRPFQAVALHALIYHTQNATVSFWQRQESSGLFDLNKIKEVRLTEFQLGGQGWIANGLTLKGTFSYNSDHINSNTPLGQDDRIPYRPDFLFKAELEMKLPWQMQLQVQNEIIGERRRGLTLPGRLPEVALLHAQVNRAFGRHIRADISFRNLLNREYVIWEGYKEPGTEIFLGVRWIY